MSSQACSGLQPLVNFPTHKTASDLRVEKIFSAASAGTVPQRCALLRGRAAPWGHTTRPAAPRSGQTAAGRCAPMQADAAKPHDAASSAR